MTARGAELDKRFIAVSAKLIVLHGPWDEKRDAGRGLPYYGSIDEMTHIKKFPHEFEVHVRLIEAIYERKLMMEDPKYDEWIYSPARLVPLELWVRDKKEWLGC